MKKPVLYMSRKTCLLLWQAYYGYEPDLESDLYFGENDSEDGLEVLYDDRMELGSMRLEESSDV